MARKKEEVRGKHARREPDKEELQAAVEAAKQDSKHKVQSMQADAHKQESKRRVDQLKAEKASATEQETTQATGRGSRFKPWWKSAKEQETVQIGAAPAAASTNHSQNEASSNQYAQSNDATVAFTPIDLEKAESQDAPAFNPTVPNGAFFGGQAPTFDSDEPKKEFPKKQVGIVLGIIVAVILAIYLIGVAFFSSHFMPGTSLNEHDLSLKGAEGAGQIIENSVKDYSVQVSGKGLNFTVTSSDMDVEVDGKSVAQKALSQFNAWAWPVEVFETHDVADALQATYNDSGLSKIVNEKVDEVNEDATDPTNASLTYNETTKSFDITPEKAGTKLDADAVLKAVDLAATSLKEKVNITDEQLVQPSIKKDDSRLASAQETANGYVKADLTLKLKDVEVGEIDGEQISQWITLSDDCEAVFDEEAMDEWLIDYANSLDTVGCERTFTRADGKEVTVSGGTYGWEVDTEATATTVRDAITEGTVGDVELPLADTETANSCKSYNPGGVEWTDYVDVDISEQHARYYDADGNLVWESDVVTGMPDGKHDTPTGTWEILYTESPATLKGDIQVSTGQPEYETKVQYWMPFTSSGCGFHDATWQPGFGGTLYASGYGSHGCVNLPYDAAAELYSLLPGDNGTAVVVHN